MKKFDAPELEVVNFQLDVIMTSNDDQPEDMTDLG